MATAAELRELDDAELLTRYSEAKQELFNLRFQHATGQLDAVSRLGQLKKDIARITTVVRQREIELADEEGAQPAPTAVPAKAAADEKPEEQRKES